MKKDGGEQMDKLAYKIIVGNEYLELNHGDKTLILSSDSGLSIVLSHDEFEMYRNIRRKYVNRGELDRYLNTNPKAYRLLLKLIEQGIFWLKEMKKIVSVETRRLSVYWGLTDNCNFKCAYCYAFAGEIANESMREEPLSIEESYKIVDQIVNMGFVELVLTGGEPLLNRNVFNIASYAKEKGLMVGLLTNGSLVSKFEIEKFKVFDYVKISLDSYDEETNDKLRGKNSYKKIISGIKLLVNNGINVTIGTVLTKYNCNQIEETIRFTNMEFGIIDHQIINHIPIGRGAESKLGCDFEKVKECDDIILKTKSELFEDKLYSIIQDGFAINGRKVSCGMGISEIFINEIGNVYPCRMTYTDEYYLGNALKEDMEIILSKVTRITGNMHVDKIEGCKECSYRYVCGGGCRMYHCAFSGSIYENNIDVCEAIKRQSRTLILTKHGINPMQ